MLLGIGDKGLEIKRIQQYLALQGYSIGTIDSEFGPKVKAAVIKWQKDHSLEQDGYIGPITLKSMQGLSFDLAGGNKVSNSDLNKFVKLIKQHSEEFTPLVEIRENAAFDNPLTPKIDKDLSDRLLKYMEQIDGFEPGEPYCAAFCGAVIVLSLESMQLSTVKFKQNFVSHVMTNVAHFKNLGYLHILPTEGSIFLAQHGSGSSGHAGVVQVVKNQADTIVTIEGNTSVGPTQNNEILQRQGNGVWTRSFNYKGRGDLRIRGFLAAKTVLQFLV